MPQQFDGGRVIKPKNPTSLMKKAFGGPAARPSKFVAAPKPSLMNKVFKPAAKPSPYVAAPKAAPKPNIGHPNIPKADFVSPKKVAPSSAPSTSDATSSVRTAVKNYGGTSGGSTSTASPTYTPPVITPKPTTTTPTTETGDKKTASDSKSVKGEKHSRGAQNTSTNRRSPKRYNSLTDQELRKLASRRFR